MAGRRRRQPCRGRSLKCLADVAVGDGPELLLPEPHARPVRVRRWASRVFTFWRNLLQCSPTWRTLQSSATLSGATLQAIKLKSEEVQVGRSLVDLCVPWDPCVVRVGVHGRPGDPTELHEEVRRPEDEQGRRQDRLLGETGT